MTLMGERVTINGQGRVVLPARLRRELDLNAGDTVIAYVKDGCLVLETPRHAARRARDLFMNDLPAGVSLVDELIAERRAEAAREVEQE